MATIDSMNVFQHCKCLKIFGSLMVLVVLSIMGTNIYAVTVSTYGAKFVESPASSFIVIVGFFSLLSMTLWSYWATLSTDPGEVPLGWQPAEVARSGLSSPRADRESSARRAQTSCARWCKKCLNWKPERCHHCSVCRRCVLKMDHHCVWVVNCVGGKNYKMFLLFLLYGFLTSLYTVCALMPYFLTTLQVHPESDPHSLSPFNAAMVFASGVLDIGFSFSLGGFIIMHLNLLLRNRTTIEMYEKKQSSPWVYDLGPYKNFQQVFGQRKRSWLIPKIFPEDDCTLNMACGLTDLVTEGLLDNDDNDDETV